MEDINKICRDTNLTDKNNGDKDKKQTLAITLIDGLLRNCRQTEALQLIQMQNRGLLEDGQWNYVN